ncbi:unnamed protein product [Acanthoscelides obtectus]|uniref:Defensin n=1 Tax=Acanthoscelides obtectus TaxID=200917 RepID=A0A9P0KJQ2_ACAOB|nr:unnamed protein product [Acanthoscelides obtectus]CAK1635554.1 hypothetical protein AOBTE_LOCUS9350 [Acanthoscelides obtectus]
MKSALVLLIVALVAAASVMPAEASVISGKWTKEQVGEHLDNVIPSYVTCVNVRCRTSCLKNGAVAGYCAVGSCHCVVPGPPGL